MHGRVPASMCVCVCRLIVRDHSHQGSIPKCVDQHAPHTNTHINSNPAMPGQPVRDENVDLPLLEHLVTQVANGVPFLQTSWLKTTFQQPLLTHSNPRGLRLLRSPWLAMLMPCKRRLGMIQTDYSCQPMNWVVKRRMPLDNISVSLPNMVLP